MRPPQIQFREHGQIRQRSQNVILHSTLAESVFRFSTSEADIDRTFKDYKTYIEEHPDAAVTQMDTVYNDVSNGLLFRPSTAGTVRSCLFKVPHCFPSASENKSSSLPKTALVSASTGVSFLRNHQKPCLLFPNCTGNFYYRHFLI